MRLGAYVAAHTADTLLCGDHVGADAVAAAVLLRLGLLSTWVAEIVSLDYSVSHAYILAHGRARENTSLDLVARMAANSGATQVFLDVAEGLGGRSLVDNLLSGVHLDSVDCLLS